MHRNMQPARVVRGMGPGDGSGDFQPGHPLPWRTLLHSEEGKDPPPPQHINKNPPFSDDSGRAGLRMGGKAEAC